MAARLVEQCAETERLLAALRVMVTAPLKDRAFWRREGFRSVATWMAAKTGTAVGPAVDALEMAVVKRLPGEGLLAHSDRGSQYASDHYQRLLGQHGITCSMSGVGQC